MSRSRVRADMIESSHQVGFPLASGAQEDYRTRVTRTRCLDSLEQIERRISDPQEFGGRHLQGPILSLVREIDGRPSQPSRTEFVTQLEFEHNYPRRFEAAPCCWRLR